MTAREAYITLTAHAKESGVINPNHRMALRIPAAKATPDQLAQAASRAMSMNDRRSQYAGHWPHSIKWMMSLVSAMGLGR